MRINLPIDVRVYSGVPVFDATVIVDELVRAHVFFIAKPLDNDKFELTVPEDKVAWLEGRVGDFLPKKSRKERAKA